MVFHVVGKISFEIEIRREEGWEEGWRESQPSARRLFLAKSWRVIERADVHVTTDFNADSFDEIIKHAPEFRFAVLSAGYEIFYDSRGILSRV